MEEVTTVVCPGCTIKDKDDFSIIYCNQCPTNASKIYKEQRRSKTNEYEGV